jgi:hypothetical protein
VQLDADPCAVIVAQLEAYIRGHFMIDPSILLTTMHSVKGDEFNEVRIYNIDNVPSSKALQNKDSHAALFASEIHLLLVAFSRSLNVTLVFETTKEREQRLEQEVVAEPDETLGDNDDSQDSAISMTLEALQASASAEVVAAARETDALAILQLPRTPESLRELKAYTDQKRRLLPSDADLALFDESVKVIRRRMLNFAPEPFEAVEEVASTSVGVQLGQAEASSDAGMTSANVGDQPTQVAGSSSNLGANLEECSICNESLGENGPVQALGCAHTFCRDCIGTHISYAHRNRMHATCPICRRLIPDEERRECADVDSEASAHEFDLNASDEDLD